MVNLYKIATNTEAFTYEELVEAVRLITSTRWEYFNRSLVCNIYQNIGNDSNRRFCWGCRLRLVLCDFKPSQHFCRYCEKFLGKQKDGNLAFLFLTKFLQFKDKARKKKATEVLRSQWKVENGKKIFNRTSFYFQKAENELRNVDNTPLTTLYFQLPLASEIVSGFPFPDCVVAEKQKFRPYSEVNGIRTELPRCKDLFAEFNGDYY